MGHGVRGKSIIYALVLAIGMSLLLPEEVFSASRSFRRSGKSRGPAVHSRHGFESSFRSGFGVELGRVQGVHRFRDPFDRSGFQSRVGGGLGFIGGHVIDAGDVVIIQVTSSAPNRVQRTCRNRNIRGPTMGGRRSRRGDLEARVLEPCEATGRALAAAGKQPAIESSVPSTRLGQSLFKSSSTLRCHWSCRDERVCESMVPSPLSFRERLCVLCQPQSSIALACVVHTHPYGNVTAELLSMSCDDLPVTERVRWQKTERSCNSAEGAAASYFDLPA